MSAKVARTRDAACPSFCAGHDSRSNPWEVDADGEWHRDHFGAEVTGLDVVGLNLAPGGIEANGLVDDFGVTIRTDDGGWAHLVPETAVKVAEEIIRAAHLAAKEDSSDLTGLRVHLESVRDLLDRLVQE